jgi:hypothetical protein
MHHKKKIRSWSAAGFVVIILLGVLFHYIYAWSGRCTIAAIFFPVNESVWEHLKLGLWAIIVFSLFEFHPLRGSVHNYCLAKAAAVIAVTLTILVIFYTYTAVTHHSILFLDILSFVLGVLLAQWLGYRIYFMRKMPLANKAGLLFMIITCVLFAWFTFRPPHYPIFFDELTRSYGY